MKFNDLSDFCRLCLMPHNGSCIDCALDDCKELRDAIKMVYNIDVSVVYFSVGILINNIHLSVFDNNKYLEFPQLS